MAIIDLDQRARDIVAGNRYLTLGTAGPDLRPRLSPVYFTRAGWRTFFWVSSPAARHSRNIAERPAVGLVILDSTAAVGHASAVYGEADATLVPDDELPAACAQAYTDTTPGAVAFTPAELSGVEPLRLYRAVATSLEIHVRGSDPEFGTGIDSRRPVEP